MTLRELVTQHPEWLDLPIHYSHIDGTTSSASIYVVEQDYDDLEGEHFEPFLCIDA